MTTSNDTIEITVNALASEWDAFFRAATSGTDAEILAAIAGLVEACPEVADYFAREVKRPTEKICKAIAVGQDALGFGTIDASVDESDFAAGGDIGSDCFDIDDPLSADIEELLDTAAMFGTLDDLLDWLAEVDPKAHEAVCRGHGWGGFEEQGTAEIADAFGCSREWARRLQVRGLSKLAAGLEAIGFSL